MFHHPTPDQSLSPVEWTLSGVPKSRIFADNYRSISSVKGSVGEFQDLGLLQSREVFIKGARLWTDHPNWAHQEHWTILETGFGLGLNFLSTWSYWLSLTHDRRPKRLTYVSIEQHPVTRDDLILSSKLWPELHGLTHQLSTQWYGLLPGFHRLEFEGGLITLLLCIGGIDDVVKDLDVQTDSIFLDGHSPKVNPQMWSHKALGRIARTAKIGTTLSTWCVSGNVLRSLNIHGFDCNKLKGIEPKRHRLEATYRGQSKGKGKGKGINNCTPEWVNEMDSRRCAVIGAGLAGAFAAYSMAKRGWSVSVFDCASHPAAAASSVPVGIFSTQLSADDNPQSKLTRHGIRLLRQLLPQLLADSKGVNWDLSGVLEVRMDSPRVGEDHPFDSQSEGESEEKSLSQPLKSSVLLRKKNPDPRGFALLGLQQAAQWYELTQPSNPELGAGLEHTQANNYSSNEPTTSDLSRPHQIWHSKGGWVVPQELVKALLEHPNIKFFGSSKVTKISRVASKDSNSSDSRNQNLEDIKKEKSGAWRLDISQPKARDRIQTQNQKRAENSTAELHEFKAPQGLDQENVLNALSALTALGESSFDPIQDSHHSPWNHVIVANSFAANHLLAPLLDASPLAQIPAQPKGLACQPHRFRSKLPELELTRGQLTWGAIGGELAAKLVSFPVNGWGTFMCIPAATPTQEKSNGQPGVDLLGCTTPHPTSSSTGTHRVGEMRWFTGSTFERIGDFTDELMDFQTPPKCGLGTSNVKEFKEVDEANLSKLSVLYPRAHEIVKNTEEIRHWEGIRCNTKNRLPWVQHFAGPDEAISKASNTPNQCHATHFLGGLSVVTGLGAKGLSLAALCAEVLTCDIHHEPSPLERNLSNMLKKHTG